jgi:hypothetical protein
MSVHCHHECVNDTSAQDRYLGRVRGLRIAVGAYVSPQALADVDSLIEHGEPAEGVCSLAWALHNARVELPSWIVQDIRSLTAGLVNPEHLPPGLGDVEA